MDVSFPLAIKTNVKKCTLLDYAHSPNAFFVALALMFIYFIAETNIFLES